MATSRLDSWNCGTCAIVTVNKIFEWLNWRHKPSAYALKNWLDDNSLLVWSEQIDWNEPIQYRLTMIKWRESFIGSRGDLKRSCGWEKNSAIDSLRSLWGQNLMEFERIHFFAKITEHWSDNPRCMCVWVSESPWVSELLWVSGLPWEILLFILNHAFYFSLPSNCVSELNFFLPKEKIPSNTTCIMNDIHKHWQYSRIDVYWQ